MILLCAKNYNKGWSFTNIEPWILARWSDTIQMADFIMCNYACHMCYAPEKYHDGQWDNCQCMGFKYDLNMLSKPSS